MSAPAGDGENGGGPPSAPPAAPSPSRAPPLLLPAPPAKDMEELYRSVFKDITPSIVLLDQVGRVDSFCVGSIILSKDESTFVLTQSNILNSHSSPQLSVWFFDGHKESASVIMRAEQLCILKTNFYPNCKPLRFFEGDIANTHVVPVAPSSKTSVYNIPGFVGHKSLEAGGDESGALLPDYKDLGVVMGDLGYYFYPQQEDGSVDLEYYVKVGFHLKACLTARYLQNFLRKMVENDDWKMGLKQMAIR